MKVATFYIFLIVCSCAATPAVPQSITTSGIIYGKVQDTGGNPLASVLVSLESITVARVSVATSPNGNFRFVNLLPGKYLLSFFRQGYLPKKEKDIFVSAGERVQVNLVLQPASETMGVIFGTVTNKEGRAMEGVDVTLESETVPQLQATTASDGFFRFEGLPAGKYLLVFKKKGFLDLKREQIELSSGADLQINVQLIPKSSPKEVPTSIERRSTGISWIYPRDYLRLLPNGQSIHAILDHTPAIDADTYSMPHSDPGLFGEYATIVARGSDNYATLWNYDGLNLNVPDGHEPAGDWKGDFPSFFDLENVEEVQIITAANDISIPTGGVTVNIISRQGGTKWHGDASFFFSNDHLQSSNIPEDVKNDPFYETTPTNRIDKLQEYSLDLGGPVIRDKLFIWGGVHQGWLDRLNIFDEFEKNKSTEYSLKTNLNLGRHQLRVGYLRTEHVMTHLDGSEILHKPDTIFPGVLSAQYSWTPEDNTILTTRYAYIGAGFRIEFPSQQSAHDFSFELDRFAEHLLAGDHELRFGFEYKTSGFLDGDPIDPQAPSSFSIQDNSALPGDPLTSGSITFDYPAVQVRSRITRTSFYAGDTYRNGRLTLNLGLRFDRQTGKNESITFPSPVQVFGVPDFLGPGFEALIRPVEYPGSDPGLAADNLSPRIGATYDLTGRGTILAFGSFARYYQAYQRSLLDFAGVGDPFSAVLGPIFTATYQNLNNDQVLTPNEITNSALTNYKDVLSQRIYDSQLTNRYVNEYVIGAQTEIGNELSVSAAFTHRSYHVFYIELPFGFTDNFHFTGTTELHTLLGDFVIPLFNFFPDYLDRGTRLLRNNNAYTQTYDGIDLMLQKRMTKNFMLSGGLVLQRQRAHGYSEDFAPWFFIPELTATLTPTVNYRVLENHAFAFNSKGLAIAPYSQWQLKLSGAYRFPRNLALGAFLRYQQGNPFVLFGFEAPPQIGFFMWVEPWEKRRYDNVLTLDLKLDKGFSLQKYGRLNLILEVFNVTNSNAVYGRYGGLGVTNGTVFEPDPTLNKIFQFLSPRLFRLGLRYSF